MSIEKFKYPTPLRVERETILNYDDVDKMWYVTSNVPKHIRRLLPLIDQTYTIRKGFNDDGRLTMLEGRLSPENARVYISKKAEYTEEQARKARERLKAYWYHKKN